MQPSGTAGSESGGSQVQATKRNMRNMFHVCVHGKNSLARRRGRGVESEGEAVGKEEVHANGEGQTGGPEEILGEKGKLGEGRESEQVPKQETVCKTRRGASGAGSRLRAERRAIYQSQQDIQLMTTTDLREAAQRIDSGGKMDGVCAPQGQASALGAEKKLRSAIGHLRPVGW